MDLLSQRYASPFLILDEFVRLNQLHNFVVEVLNTIADEKKYEVRWQYYLHKVTRVSNISFEEYVQKCEHITGQNAGYMTHEEIGNVISESKKMLEGFKPE